MVQQTEITWLLYHQPIDLFLRTAETFAKEINSLTNGRISVKIQTLQDYCNEHHGGRMVDPVALMESGAVQMTQSQVGYLGHWGAEDFYALEMPFLFDSHEHATRVLEGEIGEKLLASLADKTPVRGIAFTYSGGFRCIASRTPITSADQLEGLQMDVKTNPVFTDTAAAFGCETTALTTNSFYDYALDRWVDPNADERMKMDVSQTTSVRYATEIDANELPYMLDSKHSMYLTSILVAEDFWQTLSAEEQALWKKAATETARLERTWSVNDGDAILASADIQASLGIKELTVLSEEEQAKLKAKTDKVYDKYNTIFTPGLLDEIRAA